MKNSITKAIEISTKASLKNALKKFGMIKTEFENQEYKIAVVGEFKTGKTTLINSLFIGEEILFVSPLEATAIPTEVRYGKSPVLKVYPKSKNPIESASPEIFDNPTQRLIEEKTAGKTIEEKKFIIDTTLRAELSYNNENLKGFTIIDTPGINSNTQGILDSVDIAIQSSDLILFVKKPKQFSNTELEFLKKGVFDKGVWRGAILINDDPVYADLDKDEKEKIKKNLKAQLHDIGRDHILIKFIDFKNPTRTNDFNATNSNQIPSCEEFFEDDTSTFRDILISNPNNPSVDSSNSSVAKKLLEYLNSNKGIGRNIRIYNKFSACVNEAIAECDIALEAIKLSPKELEAAIIKINEQMNDFAQSYEKIEKAFIADLYDIQEECKEMIFGGLNEFRNDLIKELSDNKDISKLQHTVKNLEETSTYRIKRIISGAVKETEKKILNLKSKYEGNLDESFRKYSSSAVAIEIAVFDAGFLKNLSERIVTVLDYVLSAILLPTGPTGDIFIRYILGKFFPTPTNIIVYILKGTFKSKIEEFFKNTKEEISNNLKNAMDEAKADIHNDFASSIEDRRKTITAAMDKVRDPARAKLLSIAKQELNNLIFQA